VFTCGHSFHVWVPDILADLAGKAGIAGHTQVGVSSIGGSRVVQHWAIPDDKNKAKAALRTGRVDVLTLSPIYLPDEGLADFTALALEHNKDVRVLVQPIWLRWDVHEPTMKRPGKVDHDAVTAAELRERHAPYLTSIDEHVRALNAKHGRPVAFVVPAPQSLIALRERIIDGKAPGLKTQGALFTDALGHGTAPLKVLVAYCNYAVVYRRSPVGLTAPAALRAANLGENEAPLNRLLQELAWDAATGHPLSGVRRAP
jgi:antitoxin (DNA-binding transcriptional repressor) of toxin-antitoxin stability system